MAWTIQKRLIAALELRGYEHRPNPRSRRYYEMALPALHSQREVKPLLRPDENGIVPDHKILVGKRGALKWTKTNLASSIPFSERMIRQLVAEHQP